MTIKRELVLKKKEALRAKMGNTIIQHFDKYTKAG